MSWNCKKQACVALFTTEAEYIAVGSCCAQSLYMKEQLEDFGVNLDHVSLKYDNTSAIDAILPPRALDRRLQEDWAREAREGPRILMSLKVDFGPMG